jgi:2',3'-cyclic-nucleotide 2'-phosphodiesterase (5'-nucleotidase family)
MRWICFFFVLIALSAASSQAQRSALATADTEGHITPCKSCPVGVGLGGMARRATLVAADRAREPNLLLVDAGNFLFGPDSLDTRGRIMIVAYNAIGYDAVNLSYRDFRLGSARTQELLREAKFKAISANLLSTSTGEPLTNPYIVKCDSSGRRVAVLGLTEPPAGWEQIEELKRQLAGVLIAPAPQALTEWLPKAAAESDRVILLYYGSAVGLSRVRAEAGDRVSCIVVGGVEDTADMPGPVPLAVPEKHGKSIAQLTWAAAGPAQLKQLLVSPDVPSDPRMQQLLTAGAPNLQQSAITQK